MSNKDDEILTQLFTDIEPNKQQITEPAITDDSWLIGTSIENPIPAASIEFEYQTIDAVHPGCTILSQAVVHHNGRYFDVFELDNAGSFIEFKNEKVTMYFDITSFYQP